ncbi:MAG TPA: PIN domain-containing protein [Granulicella sp.]|jgi:predicted nucleic acid-binding protein|nr:PIN domain-containing protein [Granulicella sp.]
MTRYLLDTNIISNVTKLIPSPPLIEWMAEQLDDDLFIASLRLAEIWRGILEKPSGKKRKQLEAWFQGPEGPQALFRGRVLGFDETAALIGARLMSEGTSSGQPRGALDMIIPRPLKRTPAFVSDNEKHLTGVTILNPLRSPRRRTAIEV